MKKGTRNRSKTDGLREQAEKRLDARLNIMDSLADTDVRKLAHELQVHQIELEMQNEELRCSQAELEASRSKYSDLYDFAPVGYFTFDKNGMILDVNLTGAGLLSVERSRLIKKPFSQFILKESQDVFFLHRSRVLKNPEQQSCNIKLKVKSGHELYAQLESILTRDTEGNSVIMTSLIDITERMKAEEARRQLLKELAQKNLDLEQLMFITSHDLRTPLVNIEGYSRELTNSLNDLMSACEGDEVPQNIKDRLDLEVKGDIADSLKVIHNSISKMDILISGILKYSRIGKTPLSMEHIDMNAAMADIAGNFQFVQKELGAKIEISPLLPCRGDADQLSQLFSNLLDNAIKHRNPIRPCVIKISGLREENRVTYCVEDNGVGIALDYLGKIFNIFYRFDPNKVKGEGLGLTIAGRITEMHNGKIWVESEPGKGSRFYVSLPASIKE